MALKPPTPPAASSLACTGCGAPLTVRAPGRSLVVACGNCGAVLDAQDPRHQRIAKFQAATKITPKIALGTRGQLKGETWEVVGFLVRRTVIDGVPYSWFESLLHNPTGGFRWLVESNGHWTLAKSAAGVPSTLVENEVQYLGVGYHHFQTARAEVSYVVGEFPWQVRAGEVATVDDYVRPPLLVSCERTPTETTWSVGEYVPGETVWKAFKLPGAPPDRIGVGAAQPSPFKPHSQNMLLLVVSFLALGVLLHIVVAMLSQRLLVADVGGQYVPQQPETHTLVSEPFELTGRRSNVMVETSTSASNNWVYFNLALVDETTGAARSFGREVSYYFGQDSDGSWSEGANWDRTYMPGVPSGRYRLVVEPEGPTAVNYRVRLTRDVPRPLWTWVALGLLVVPPLLFWYRQYRFEFRRWQESDHPMGTREDDNE